ncbi:MAG TPA: hypothetical protein VIP70_05675 [Nitrososphaeraceae archaeon]
MGPTFIRSQNSDRWTEPSLSCLKSIYVNHRGSDLCPDRPFAVSPRTGTPISDIEILYDIHDAFNARALS